MEDNSRDAELTLNALRGIGLAEQVAHVRDGAEALDYLYRKGSYADRTSCDPTVVLLDLKLPKIDGLEVLRQIKEDGALRTIPVVVLSSSREDRDVRTGYQLGANAYLVKPLKLKQFVHLVQQTATFWATLNEIPQAAGIRARS